MFGISFLELSVILILTLILFGPDKLPEAARALGKWAAFLRRNTEAVRREFYNTIYEPSSEIKLSLEAAKKELTSVKQELLSEEEREDSGCEEYRATRAREKAAAALKAAAAAISAPENAPPQSESSQADPAAPPSISGQPEKQEKKGDG